MQQSLKSLATALLSSLALGALNAAAQAQQPIALPGISVRGATLDVRPIGPTQPAQAAPAQQPSLPQETADGIPLERIGTSVSVLTRGDIERAQYRSAADALRGLPGVSVSGSGTEGSLTVVRIRGAESRHTLVVIDGVEMNSGTDGIFDFSNLTADDIERIEVLRGPQSGLYGNGALGGVINIQTKSGRGPLTLRAQTEAGSLGTRRLGAQLSGGNDKIWGSFSATGYTTDGFNISTSGNELDGTRIASFAARGGLALSSALKVEGSFRQQNTVAGFDQGFATLYKGFFAPADAPYIGDGWTRVANINATLDTFGKAWIHNFYVQGAQTLRIDTSTTVLESTSLNGKFGYKSTWLLEGSRDSPVRHFITGLMERRTESFEQPNFSPEPFHTRNRNSIAGEIRGEYFKSLFLAATLRHDQNDTTENFTTWHVDGSYILPGKIFRLHASAGNGVKYPSFGDLFGFFTGFAPNPNLKPEQSVGYDFGIETKLLNGRALIDTTYFNSDLTNEIAISCPPPTFICVPYNLATPSTRQGIEVAGKYLLTPQITLGAAYTYLHAREDIKTQEVRRPPHQGRVEVNYAMADGRGNLNLSGIYNGDMKDVVTDAAFNTVYTTLPSYWLVRVAASYKLQPGVEFFGRVENALNQHYQEVFGYNGTAGTTAFAGVKLTFGGKDGVGGTWAK